MSKIWKVSYPVSYFTDDFKHKYKSFLAASNNHESSAELEDALPYVNSEYPYSDFCIVTVKNSAIRENIKGNLARFMQQCGSFQIETVSFDDNIFIIHDGEILDDNGNICLFSGITRTEDRIIIGINDIYGSADLKSIDEGYGCIAFRN